MEHTKIEWATHTFNPWIGCQHVSPGCANCYAEAQQDHRYGRVKWGANQRRVRTSASTWDKPRLWNQKAAAAGRRERVFCASLADVFDGEVPDPWRRDLWALIRTTPHLDWLLLTKRPLNMTLALGELGLLPNIWLGVSVENADYYWKRVPALIQQPAVVRFLSVEPLLGPVRLEPPHCYGIDWVIVGGESGPNARPMESRWVEYLQAQCDGLNIPFFFKQWGGVRKETAGRLLHGVTWSELPKPQPSRLSCTTTRKD